MWEYFLLFYDFSCTMMPMISIMQKILSFTLLCLSFFPIFTAHAAGDTDVTSQQFTVKLADMDPLGDSHNGGSPAGGIDAFKKILTSITDILLFMIPIFAAVSMLIAGYFYIFSAGDSEKANKAKTIIKWNIVAILVAFLSYGIVKIVASLFSQT